MSNQNISNGSVRLNIQHKFKLFRGQPFKCQPHKMAKHAQTNCFFVFNHFVGLALNPFRTAKPATNDNHRPCLKSKPQVKCHWSFRVGQTSEDEGHSRRTFDSRHSPQDKPRKATHARPDPPTPDTAHKLPNILERANLALPPAFHSKHKALWFSWILFK